MWKWLSSKNCFLKNIWFWLFSLGIAAVIFFTGGLAFALVALIPILAVVADTGHLSVGTFWRWIFPKKETTPTQSYQSVNAEEKDTSSFDESTSTETKLSSDASLPAISQTNQTPLSEVPNTGDQQDMTKNKRESVNGSKRTPQQLHENRFIQALYLLQWFGQRNYFKPTELPPEAIQHNAYIDDQLQQEADTYLERLPSSLSTALAAMKQLPKVTQKEQYPRLENAGIFVKPTMFQSEWDQTYKKGFKNLRKEFHPDKNQDVPENIILTPILNTPVEMTKSQILGLYNVVNRLVSGFTQWMHQLAPINPALANALLSTKPQSLLGDIDSQIKLLHDNVNNYCDRVDAYTAKVNEEYILTKARNAAIDAERRAVKKETAAIHHRNCKMVKMFVQNAVETNDFQTLVDLSHQTDMTSRILELINHTDPSLRLTQPEFAALKAHGLIDASVSYPKTFFFTSLFSSWNRSGSSKTTASHTVSQRDSDPDTDDFNPTDDAGDEATKKPISPRTVMA